MDIRFKCTQCGQCCRGTKIPLTVSEAIEWLCRGHDVQLICEASPWPSTLDGDPRALPFKRRSFEVTSGSMSTRVVAILVANAVGDCPNLLPNLQCGIYEERPLVCRIYPAEVNPFIALKPDKKACPPEAWAAEHPLLQRGGLLMDEVIQRDVESSRSADAFEALLKSRLCLALNVVDTALVHEAVLVYSPPSKTLLSALAFAISAEAAPESGPQWRFVSDQSHTLRALSRHGGMALHLRDAESAAYQHFAFKREAIFGFEADTEGLQKYGRPL